MLAAKAQLLVVLGASGSGKTSAVRRLEARARPALRCFYFDDIGVPSAAEMQRDFASGDAWQADATRRWLERLSASAEPGVVSVLEGQTRPSFVRAGSDGSLELRMVLLQCNAEVRAERLCLRGQPELANARMDSWAAYLRGQADALGLPVIDTSELTPDEVADALERELYPQRAPHAARSSNS